MGRLPDSFAGRPITGRVPFTLYGTIDMTGFTNLVTPSEVRVTHNADRPFEIHRMVPLFVNAEQERKVFGQVFDFTKQQNLFKEPQPFGSVTRSETEHTWEWAEPYYLERSEGFVVSLHPNPAFFPVVGEVHMPFTFQGFLVNVAPASDHR